MENRTRRRAALQGLRSCVNLYVSVAWPGDCWTCTGVEIALGRCRADPVWSHERGAVVVDELKTGQDVPGPGDAQVADLLVAGMAGRGRLGSDPPAGTSDAVAIAASEA